MRLQVLARRQQPGTCCWSLAEIFLWPHRVPFCWLWGTGAACGDSSFPGRCCEEAQVFGTHFSPCWSSVSEGQKARRSLGNSPAVVSFLAGGPRGLRDWEVPRSLLVDSAPCWGELQQPPAEEPLSHRHL